MSPTCSPSWVYEIACRQSCSRTKAASPWTARAHRWLERSSATRRREDLEETSPTVRTPPHRKVWVDSLERWSPADRGRRRGCELEQVGIYVAVGASVLAVCGVSRAHVGQEVAVHEA